MYTNVILIGGIHGVGKGTICKELAYFFNIKHITASEIIKWEKYNSSKGNKLVSNISVTQNELLKKLKEIINPKNKYILDGHLCLFDTDHNIIKIPLEIIDIISPALISIIISDIDTIYERLVKRDNISYSKKTLSELQKCEIEYGKEVSKLLRIPFITVKQDNINPLKNQIELYLSN